LFAERLERIGETSTQNPCGLGQTLVMALLTQWTFDGYFRWLRGLRTQYKHRRDFLVDCLAEEFELLPETGTASLCAYPRGSSEEKARSMRPLLSFVPPSSGMFVWVKLYFGNVPDKRDESDGSVLTPERQFWQLLADAGVLVAPGWIFFPETHTKQGGAPPSETDRQIGHMRVSFTPSDVSGVSFSITLALWIDGDNPDGDDAPGHKDFRADPQRILCLGFY
jgi:aromatic amino acid aminotransferase I